MDIQSIIPPPSFKISPASVWSLITEILKMLSVFKYALYKGSVPNARKLAGIVGSSD